MKHIVTKFSKAGYSVVDTCAGAFMTASACMLLSKKHSCSLHAKLFHFASLIRLLRSQRRLWGSFWIANRISRGSSEVLEAAQRYVQVIYGINAWNKRFLEMHILDCRLFESSQASFCTLCRTCDKTERLVRDGKLKALSWPPMIISSFAIYMCTLCWL